MSQDFTYDQEPQIHIRRAREIYAKHPEVRELMGPNPKTALWAMALVFTQWAVAYGLTHVGWIWVVVVAYLFGAFLNHALFVVMHECAHNLVFRDKTRDSLLSIFGDLALAAPGAMAFRKAHIQHHNHLGSYEKDPDIVSRSEAELIGNSAWRKALWVFLLGLSQALRPLRLKNFKLTEKWIIANTVVVIAFDIALVLILGPKALVYLGLSTLFALGLHPLGGRWIQEHYVTKEGQETYSYYGPLNKASFNVGYHNEHHDFASIPWNNLPKLKAMAPEYYDNLKSYRSWTGLLLRFIFDRSMSTFSRIVHEPKTGTAAAPESSQTAS